MYRESGEGPDSSLFPGGESAPGTEPKRKKKPKRRRLFAGDESGESQPEEMFIGAMIGSETLSSQSAARGHSVSATQQQAAGVDDKTKNSAVMKLQMMDIQM